MRLSTAGPQLGGRANIIDVCIALTPSSPSTQDSPDFLRHTTASPPSFTKQESSLSERCDKQTAALLFLPRPLSLPHTPSPRAPLPLQNFFEVGINVHVFRYIARKTLYSFREQMHSMVAKICGTVEGRTDDGTA